MGLQTNPCVATVTRHPEGNKETRTLLIVEDNPSLAAVLAWHFEQAGYSVTTAPDCRAALRLMDSTRFDAAMVDYQLPDGSGLDLCAKLVYQLPEIPVILMSGACDPTLPARAAATGAFSFLKKPFHPESAARLFEQAFG